MTNTTTTERAGKPDRAGRVEGVVQAVIMAGIGVMAGAASFTHMHDWTMHNAPTGTGDWFGWANAVASELTPTVAVLDIRRRRRAGKRITYPTVVLVCSVALSLSAQFACARASVSGWLLAAVPAIAFLALTKMVLTGARNPSPATDAEPESDQDSLSPAIETHEEIRTAPAPASASTPTISAPVTPAAAVVRPDGSTRPMSINGVVVTSR
jgi:hypothetical protein